MAQFFDLRGTPIQVIPELRVDLIMDQSANVKILEVDNANNAVNLFNVKAIYTRAGTEILTDKIQVNP
tara:strand:+ start:73 stop:276 length:204 start_codon:yes stop_codon:yes gene_type:complete